MPKNLFKIAKEKKIKYFLISFVDLFGVLRSKLVPARAIQEMQVAGAGFAQLHTAKAGVLRVNACAPVYVGAARARILNQRGISVLIAGR